MRAQRFPAVALGALLLAVDWGSKTVAPGLTSQAVRAAANPALMLGIADPGRAATAVLALAGTGAAAALATALCARGRLSPFGLAVLLAGLIGNLEDRLVLGHVRDWIVTAHVTWNLADLYLLVAIPWLVVATGQAWARGGARSSETRPGVT